MNTLRHRCKTILLLAFLLSLSPSAFTSTHDNSTSDESKPNIIIIYADDLGYGDVASFSDTKIRTPNIDELADKGIKFTDFYSVSAVCTPSRFGLLTGRYPIRRGLAGTVFWPDSWAGMPEDEVTIAEMLKTSGYATGMVGKWHLGHVNKYLPTYQGFDEFFGAPYSNDMKSFVLLKNEDVVDFSPDQSQLTLQYTQASIDFISRHKDQPFFLYIAHSMPHVPIYASKNFKGKSKQGLYADVIEELDWSVGKVTATLKNLNLDKNTLVIFSSDNGPWLTMGEHGGSPGILREGKFTTFEGGVRVPTIASWPAKITAKQNYKGAASMLDWLPTIADITKSKLPQATIDGRSLKNILEGNTTPISRTLPYFERSDVSAIRVGNWKLKIPHPGNSVALVKRGAPGSYLAHNYLLFDLSKDPGEKNDLASAMPEKVAELKKEIVRFKASLGPLEPRVQHRSKADNSYPAKKKYK